MFCNGLQGFARHVPVPKKNRLTQDFLQGLFPACLMPGHLKAARVRNGKTSISRLMSSVTISAKVALSMSGRPFTNWKARELSSVRRTERALASEGKCVRREKTKNGWVDGLKPALEFRGTSRSRCGDIRDGEAWMMVSCSDSFPSCDEFVTSGVHQKCPESNKAPDWVPYSLQINALRCDWLRR